MVPKNELLQNKLDEATNISLLWAKKLQTIFNEVLPLVLNLSFVKKTLTIKASDIVS